MRRVAILGSTGSIGTQALDVIRAHPERFQVVALSAAGGDPGKLAAQALEFGVEAVAVARGSAAQDVQLAFYAAAQAGGYAVGEYQIPKIFVGPAAATELANWPADLVLNGITGAVGLAPTVAALTAGRTVALANKESLVAGGPLVRKLARPGQLIPVDSEHSALAQCMRSGERAEVSRLILTASGGPFRGYDRAGLAQVTVEQALTHPTWDMGPMVTINSATLMNKALEVIEAHELFDLPYDQIDVVVHPQSMIHSMVEFQDGSTIAHASPPDMRLPIGLALDWPHRLPRLVPTVDWTRAATWTFEPVDGATFPAIRLAKSVGTEGKCLPAIFNAANEEAVAAFIEGRLPFVGIVDTVERVCDQAPDFASPGTVDDVIKAQEWAKRRTREIIEAAE